MIQKFCTCLINNNSKEAELIFNKSAGDLSVIENLIVPAMNRIGELWENQEISLSQIYLSSKIVEKLVRLILPSQSPERKAEPEIAIAALEDYHMMGKNIVLAIVMASGCRIKDLGRVTVEELKNILLKTKYDIMLLSTLMLPSALNVELITDFIQTENLKTKVVVGGAPFNFDNQLAEKVGADFFCEKASDVLKVIEVIREITK